MHTKMDRVDDLERMRWSARSSPSKGPKRLCKFCLFAILLPVVFLCIPLYMRYQALKPHLLMLSPADMKLLNQESRMSTVWCQGQELSMNGSFNAYLLAERPRLLRYKQHVTMNRKMMLEDDIKEFWGFYLLKGSTVRLSVCSRHEGANFIIVKSLKDAKRCAFLGELDSVEESDEISNEFEFAHEISEYLNNGTERPLPGAQSATVLKTVRQQSGENLELDQESLTKMTKPELVRKLLLALKNKNDEDEREGEILRKFNAYQVHSPDDEAHGDEHGDLNAGVEDLDLDSTTLSPLDESVYAMMDRGKFNQQNEGDESKEETRSSWSSSEELLAACEGLIFNEQLLGGTKCHDGASKEEIAESATTVTLQANETGFYYFIFANENEITDNFLSASFHLHKTVFDVSANVRNCTNATTCELPLTFWSEDHVVLEVPETDKEGSEGQNEEDKCTALHGYSSLSECHRVVLAESVCQPRRALYMAFLLCVPVLVLTFAYI